MKNQGARAACPGLGCVAQHVARLVLYPFLIQMPLLRPMGGVRMRGSATVGAWPQRGKTMRARSVFPFLTAGFLWIFLLLTLPDATGEQRGPSRGEKEKKLFIVLTEDFYRALQSESDSGNRVYGDRRSDEYLRQIAVSAKFMVETNLRLLEVQERMVELLERAPGSP